VKWEISRGSIEEFGLELGGEDGDVVEWLRRWIGVRREKWLVETCCGLRRCRVRRRLGVILVVLVRRWVVVIFATLLEV